jgi:ElaB/YqjD/DUF883 family membrane-anchored ribosome-binding protein
MAEASLKIQADFLSAIEQFNKLAAASEQMGQKIQEAQKKFGGTYIDDFINKQKLTEAAVIATKGEASALSNAIKAYQKEIEHLIKNGLSPQSGEIEKLKTRLVELTAEQDKVTEASRAVASQAREAAAAAKEQADADQEAMERIAAVTVKMLDA